MTTPVRIVIVDDHRLVARSLKAYLESFPEFTVAGIAANGEDLLAHIEEWQPQIVLQDLLLPGGIDGIETTKRVLARAPQVRVVALTASTDSARMTGVLRAGATGYVRKDAEPEVLLAAVRAVSRGRSYVDAPAAAVDEPLTARETEVLQHLISGESNKGIAVALGISEETVKTHVANLLAKLQAENRAQAAVHAFRRGLVS